MLHKTNVFPAQDFPMYIIKLEDVFKKRKEKQTNYQL